MPARNAPGGARRTGRRRGAAANGRRDGRPSGRVLRGPREAGARTGGRPGGPAATDVSRSTHRREAGTRPGRSGRSDGGAGAARRAASRLGAAIGLALGLAGAGAGCGPSDPAPAAAAPPLPAALDGFRADAWFLPDDPLLGFVEIPAGPVVMGSDPAVDPAAFANERWSAGQAQGRIDLPTFYIGRYEVTVAQFRAFADAAGAAVSPAAQRGAPAHPVASVSWPDALAYARWLDATLAAWPDTPAPLRRRLDDGWRVTLPSEAEWAKAARGGDGRIYPWGDAPDPDLARYGGADGPLPVGRLDCPACPFGLRDLSGNVWELTRSPYQPYPYDEADDADDLDADALFVMRGGSFQDPAGTVRAAVRGGADPGARRPFIGFRVVLTPP